MNSSYQLKRHSEITGINQIDFSLNHSADDEELFGGDISYTTSANNFGITWTGLKVKKTDEVSHNIKIAFQIEERSFPNFAEAFSTSKNECGVFEDMVDDSFIIPLKTNVPNVILHHPVKSPTFLMPKNHASRLFLKVK